MWMPIICGSLKRPFFIANLVRYLTKKILLLNITDFRGITCHQPVSPLLPERSDEEPVSQALEDGLEAQALWRLFNAIFAASEHLSQLIT
jgi:hypothetical protein